MIVLKTFLLACFQYLCLELLAFAYLLILTVLKVKIYLKKESKNKYTDY